MEDWLKSKGEMAARIRAHDWTDTCLGPLENWPRYLRITLEVALSSAFPTALIMGPDRLTLYNDAYRMMLGDKHDALGQPFSMIWEEVWDQIHSYVDAACRGTPVRMDDFRATIQRSHVPEEAVFTFSMNPLRDEEGGAAGMILTVIEMTRHVNAERGQAFLLSLNEQLRMVRDESGVLDVALAALGIEFGYSRVGYAELLPEGLAAIVRQEWRSERSKGEPLRLSQNGLRTLCEGYKVRIDDVGSQEQMLAPGGEAAGIGALTAVPIVGRGRSWAFLYVGTPGARRWSETDLLVLQQAADQIGQILQRVRADAALVASEERFRLATEAFEGGTYEVDLDSDRTYHSPTSYALIGYRSDEVEHTLSWWWKRIHPDDAPRLVDAWNQVRKLGHSRFDVEYRARHKDGHYVWLWQRAILVDSGGKHPRVAGAIIDISARKAIEMALRDSQERFGAIVNQAAVGIAELDAQGRFTYVNDHFCAMVGRSVAELVGRATSADVVHPDDVERSAPLLRALFAHGTAFSIEKRYVRSDGTILWAENNGGAIRDEQGRIVRGVVISIDISDRIVAERRVRDNERWMRSLMEGVPQLVWRSAAGGRWTWAGPQWTVYTGQRAAESHDLGWLECVHPDDRAIAMACWEQAGARETFAVEYRVRQGEDGRYRWFQTRATPVRGTDGTIVEWLGTSTDNNDLHMLRDRQEVLVAELQHRTRNLLAIVRSISQQTSRTSTSLDAFQEQFSSRLAALSRVQGILSRGSDQPTTLAELVRAELAAHGGEEERRQLSIHGPDVRLSARAVQSLALALHELATNAVKYGALHAPGSGSLSIEWSFEDHREGQAMLVLVWRERGVAMPPMQPERRGYGRELIERALPYDLSAQTVFELKDDGVYCRIALPKKEAHLSGS